MAAEYLQAKSRSFLAAKSLKMLGLETCKAQDLAGECLQAKTRSSLQARPRKCSNALVHRARDASPYSSSQRRSSSQRHTKQVLPQPKLDSLTEEQLESEQHQSPSQQQPAPQQPPSLQPPSRQQLRLQQRSQPPPGKSSLLQKAKHVQSWHSHQGKWQQPRGQGCEQDSPPQALAGTREKRLMRPHSSPTLSSAAARDADIRKRVALQRQSLAHSRAEAFLQESRVTLSYEWPPMCGAAFGFRPRPQPTIGNQGLLERR